MRAAILALLCASSCTVVDLHPELGPPFTCPDQKCPSGYACLQNLCIADGAPAPPLLVATTAIDDAPGVPVWTGSEFAVAWDDSSSPTAPGIYLATLGTTATSNEELVFPSSGALTFSFLREPMTGTFVIAEASNGLTGGALTVLGTRSTVGSPTTLLSVTSGYSPIGFSQPSLATRGDGTVTLAYTLTIPPAQVTETLKCARLSLTGGVTDGACGPTKQMTTLSASSVAVAEFTASTIFAWRSNEGLELSAKTPSGLENDPVLLSNILTVEKLVNVNAAAHEFGIIGETLGISDMGAKWGMFLSTGMQSDGISGQTFSTGAIVPDIDGDGTRFFVCTGDLEGGVQGVSILTLAPDSTSPSGLSAVGTARKVSRYSVAPIESCRIAYAPETKTLGILWRERTPPATGTLYFETMSVASP